MASNRAFRIHYEEGKHRAGIEELPLPEVGEGEVLIAVHYSSVNYKDALAGTGKGKIMRRFPLTGGIDAAGEVVQSRHRGFKEGDPVIATSYGMSQTHDGGYAERLKVPGDWIVPLPDGLSLFEAMALGTAGFTAGLALHKMEINGQRPGLGPIVVTGASGGVGTLAVDMLDSEGYEVVAVSGKREQHGFLEHLGAGQVLARNELPIGRHPLEKALWGGAIDSVGGEMLEGLTRTVVADGNIASVGLAGGHRLHTTVMPFILRGISLLGINSADTPIGLRKEIWQRLASDLKPRHLDEIVERVVRLGELHETLPRLLEGAYRGRVVVQVAD